MPPVKEQNDYDNWYTFQIKFYKPSRRQINRSLCSSWLHISKTTIRNNRDSSYNISILFYLEKKKWPAWRTAWWSSKLSIFGKTSPHWEQAQMVVRGDGNLIIFIFFNFNSKKFSIFQNFKIILLITDVTISYIKILGIINNTTVPAGVNDGVTFITPRKFPELHASGRWRIRPTTVGSRRHGSRPSWWAVYSFSTQ